MNVLEPITTQQELERIIGVCGLSYEESQEQECTIVWAVGEPLKIRLGEKTMLLACHPDFLVKYVRDVITKHEVEDAATRPASS